jgi:uncharacterized phage protein (TIGR01671 family)
MKREIKFRAWDELNKIMHFDFQFIKSGDEDNDWIIFISDKQPLGWDEIREQSKPYPFNNPFFAQQLQIMQFAGLKDKNGKEIYEGDIIRGIGTNVNAKLNKVLIIDFKDGAFCVTAQKVKTNCDLSITIRDLMFQAKRLSKDIEFEVIGNIYENPELL